MSAHALEGEVDASSRLVASELVVLMSVSVGVVGHGATRL